MLPIGPTLEKFIHERRLVKKRIAEQAGITPAYLAQVLKKETLDCLLFERLCNAVEVSPMEFFSDNERVKKQIAVGDVTANSMLGPAKASVHVEDGTVSVLRELLAEKERVIKILLAQLENRDKNGTNQ